MTMEKLKHGTKEYWHNWYWNRGGRAKVQASRKISETIDRIRKAIEKYETNRK